MPPMEEPNDDLCEQIVQQVEFYFSDANITKDKFLLKHVKRNKEGFVSLKLISSFKRVKHLTKDWRQVAVAIERKSNKLEVNDLKTKVIQSSGLSTGSFLETEHCILRVCSMLKSFKASKNLQKNSIFN
jgi:hypothetical protein